MDAASIGTAPAEVVSERLRISKNLRAEVDRRANRHDPRIRNLRKPFLPRTLQHHRNAQGSNNMTDATNYITLRGDWVAATRNHRRRRTRRRHRNLRLLRTRAGRLRAGRTQPPLRVLWQILGLRGRGNAFPTNRINFLILGSRTVDRLPILAKIRLSETHFATHDNPIRR